MQKKILIINKWEFMRNYLKDLFEEEGFEIILGRDGLDGYLKMRNQLPDLIIIESSLLKMNIIDFLRKKNEFKGTMEIPLIMLYSNISRDVIVKISKFYINKYLPLPLDIDALCSVVNDIFNTEIKINKYPCVIDLSLKNEILFMEIYHGLEVEEINQMKHQLNNFIKNDNIEKILIAFNKLPKQKNFYEMLDIFSKTIHDVLSEINIAMKICILTSIKEINNYFAVNNILKDINITDNFNKAINILINDNDTSSNFQKKLKNEFYYNNNEKGSNNDYYINNEGNNDSEIDNRKRYKIAVIDDDELILEYMGILLDNPDWDIKLYCNGKVFVNDLECSKVDLILLDLNMPIMNGFDVLEYLKKENINTPVIVLSALNDKQSILRVKNSNVKSYFVKPFKSELLINKTKELLTYEYS